MTHSWAIVVIFPWGDWTLTSLRLRSSITSFEILLASVCLQPPCIRRKRNKNSSNHRWFGDVLNFFMQTRINNIYHGFKAVSMNQPLSCWSATSAARRSEKYRWASILLEKLECHVLKSQALNFWSWASSNNVWDFTQALESSLTSASAGFKMRCQGQVTRRSGMVYWEDMFCLGESLEAY